MYIKLHKNSKYNAQKKRKLVKFILGGGLTYYKLILLKNG